MHTWSIKRSLFAKFFTNGLTFRDESNESSSTMINYSDATITTHNYPLIIRLNVLLATSYATVL